MILGAVLGLLEEFDGPGGQLAQHTLALEGFDELTEKRRYAYTAYYRLAYGWDREVLKKVWADDLNAGQLIEKAKQYDKILSGTDEKYDLFRKVADLREAVRLADQTIAFDRAQNAHKSLWEQLNSMKPENVDRYYDVDTMFGQCSFGLCSISP